MTTAVLVAAGSSRRMGFDKLAAKLDGRSVLATSVGKFLRHESIDAVVVVSTRERFESLQTELEAAASPLPDKSLLHTEGGARRQDSVSAGLATCPEGTDLVAVHDAARPLVATEDIARCLASVGPRGGSLLASPVADSLWRSKRPSKPPQVAEAVARRDLWAAQTPQCFHLAQLQAALDHCHQQGIEVTDEVAAARAIDLPVQLVKASSPNLKLTHPADLALARALRRQE